MNTAYRLVLVLSLWAPLAHAQNAIKLDSLQLALQNATHDTSRINAMLELSYLYANTNFAKGLETAREAKQLAIDKKYPRQEAKMNVAIANLSLHQGDYKTASTHYFYALKYYETTRNNTGMTSIHNNLGATYDRLGDYDKALAHYFKAQEFLNLQPPSPTKQVFTPSLYNNIGNVYQSKGDPKSALQYYQKGLDLALLAPKHRVRGQLYNNIGKLYLNDLKEPQKAFEYLTLGLNFRRDMGEQGEIARSLIILSDYFHQQDNQPEAKSYALMALQIGKELGSLDVQRMSYDCITRVEEAMGNYKAALEMHKQFKKLSDSIQGQLASSEITKLQLQYDFEKAEKTREQEESQSRSRYLTAISILSLLLTVAVLLALIVRSRARQTELRRKNLAQDVEIKNKELTTNVMYLVRKNELINNVAERLLKLEPVLVPDTQRTLHEIIIELQREADSDTWKEFELRFNQVHSEFYKNLRKQYPGLSPAEEKLCAFLRLNMSSKEIAAITQQSIKSVEVARARLRKKLNLTNTNSNLVTHLGNL